MKPTNSDERRDLYEFEYPVTKILVAKENCELGNHYHKLKDEVFMLLSGSGKYNIQAIGELDMIPFDRIYVPAFQSHSFTLDKGSILIGFCTKPYDPTDDYHD